MTEKGLIVNAGSSSLKFALYEMPNANLIVSGLIERIGEEISNYKLKFDGQKIENKTKIENHTIAAHIMLRELIKNNFIENTNEIKFVGHRVLHGGEKYSDSVVIDNEVKEDIKYLTKLGPLHHPGEMAGIEAMEQALPNITQVAVFDTAFHQTMPKENYIYPVPYEWYKENGVRKYGFHGTSHKYITEYMQKLLNKQEINLINCHIGSGASICCIKDGKSFDTTMGLTPLDGLVMGTRSGAVDPSILEYIENEKGLTSKQTVAILNNQSGLKGICGKNDFRDVCELAKEGNENAILAIKIFKQSIEKYISEYYVRLNGNVDAIIFTAGVGENVSFVREDIINELSCILNSQINKDLNDKIASFKEIHEGLITTKDSKVPVYVIPTNEEYMILSDAYNLYQKGIEKGFQKVKK